jgi:hypothetical protein
MQVETIRNQSDPYQQKKTQSQRFDCRTSLNKSTDAA